MRTITLLILCLSSLSSIDLYGETYYLVPHRFKVAEIKHQPALIIAKIAGGYRADITFTADYEESVHFLIANSIDPVSYVPLPFDVRKFTFLSELLEDSIVIKKIEQHFFINALKVRIEFNSDFELPELRTLLTFGIVYGEVKGVIHCTKNQTVHRLCGHLFTLSVNNQFNNNHRQLDASLEVDFFLLNKYRNKILYSGSHRLSTIDDLEKVVETDLLTSTRRCKGALTEYKLKICQKIIKYSLKQKLNDALSILIQRLTTKRHLISNATKIFSGNEINISTSKKSPPSPSRSPKKHSIYCLKKLRSECFNDSHFYIRAKRPPPIPKTLGEIINPVLPRYPGGWTDPLPPGVME